MSKNQITEILKKTFPHWTDKQISDFEKFLTSSFTNVTNKDFDVILTNLNDSILTVIRKYDIQSTQPGRLRTIYKRMLFNIYDQNKRKSPLKELGEYFEERYDGLDEINSIEKIQNFFRVIRKSNALTKAFDPLCEHLEIVSLKLIEELNENSETWKRKDFWDEVELSLKKSGIVYSDENFRQLQSRLKNRLIERLPDAEGLLHLHKDNKEEEKALQQLLFALSFTSINYLKAYRFSEEELEKMIWLKKLFEENGYTFEPNRFPEVYYDDFEILDEIFRFSKNLHYVDLSKRTEDNYANVEPDALGCYIPAFASNLICTESYEGVVVLFKDRIEAFANSSSKPSGITLESIKFVVLIHELGHWLTHWALKGGKNWKYGYNLYPQTRRTHEALAQLIAYWASEDSKINLDTLNLLSHKDASGKIDPTQIYGGYIELTAHSKVSMLQKLSEIREFWMLKDEFMIEYLKAVDFDDIEKWIKTLSVSDPKEPWKDIAENEVVNTILGPECFDAVSYTDHHNSLKLLGVSRAIDKEGFVKINKSLGGLWGSQF